MQLQSIGKPGEFKDQAYNQAVSDRVTYGQAAFAPSTPAPAVVRTLSNSL